MTYIHHLASDLLKRFGTDLSRIAVVFPNKRASLFLNEELAHQANAGSGKEGCPIWSPSYITISELFRKHSDLEVTDQILLVCRLYDVYCRVTGIETETLDRFYNWGLLLLADFDDIDKNMADAEKVFQIVTDLHELDSVEYITPDQREALKSFFGNFTDDHQSLMQERFMRMWSKLYEIYTTFREELRNDNLAYEGMLYRDVIEHTNIDFEYDTYCFVGFNMLQKVEQRLFMRLKLMEQVTEQPRALFYWDYCTSYLTPQHEAGHFISEYLSSFPDALGDCPEVHSPIASSHKSMPTEQESDDENDITFASAPTENLQARYVHDWLLKNDRWKAGAKTAIVMCDEKLLQTIIRSLPDEVKKVNITTGYPLSQSPVVSFLQLLIELQTAGKISGTDKYRMKYVGSVLCHPYSALVSDKAQERFINLKENKQYYPTRKDLSADGALGMLFCDLDSITMRDYDVLSQNVRLTIWLQKIIRHIAQQKNVSNALDSECLFRTYQILQRLLTLSIDNTLNVDIVTFRRLLMQIVGTTTVPYHGEPIEGIQIMGVLETRCLDFEHLLVLSCNEGNMPKGVNDSSFIPHSVRSAYGLTTVENKVGIYSYYFNRLLHRCKDVTLAYNSSTDGLNTGEMSRFMLQLMAENDGNGRTIRRISMQTGQETCSFSPKPIVKDNEIQKRLYEMLGKGHSISPSSLGQYLRCQVQYFYKYVVRLSDTDDRDPEEIDNIAFGLVFHKAAEMIYNGMKDADGMIHAAAIDSVLKNQPHVKRCIDDAFALLVFHTAEEDNQGNIIHKGYKPEYNGLQLINRRVILRLVNDLLRYDRKSAPIQIVGLETKAYSVIPVTINGKVQDVTIGGIIDRLDIVGNKQQGYTMRVIDYKTGAYKPMSLKTLDDIFDSKNIKHHSQYFLQAMLYSHNVSQSQKLNPGNIPVSPYMYFVQGAHLDDFDPKLNLSDGAINNIKDYDEAFIEGLSQVISDIQDPDKPFEPNLDNCTHCTFKNICGI